MATVKDIYCAMDEWAPFETQMDFDNAGFLVGPYISSIFVFT